MNRIFAYVINMLPYMMSAIPFVLLIRIAMVHWIKKKGLQTTFGHELVVSLFMLFMVGLFSQTIIPKIDFSVGGIGIVNGNLTGEINLIPGKVFVDTWRESFANGYWLYFVINFVGNICMFIPIGFCAPLLWHRMTFFKTLLFGFLTSLFIEICQLPQARGSDVDDLWLNTLGAAIGWLLYMVLSRFADRFCVRFKVKR